MNRVFRVATVAAGAGFAVWQGGLSRSSTQAHVGILAVIGLGVVTTVVAGIGRQPRTSLEWARGPVAVRRHWREDPATTLVALVWVALVLAAIGWDLNSFVHQSADLPTLSRILGHVSDHEAGRALMVAVWLLLGGAIALGWRRPR